MATVFSLIEPSVQLQTDYLIVLNPAIESKNNFRKSEI